MNFLKKVRNHIQGHARQVLKMPDPYQPFGPDFGLTVFPEYIRTNERKQIRDTFVNTYFNSSGKILQSDGRIQMPPVQIETFEPVITRLEDEGYIPPGWVNNQTCNMYQPGDFIRAHIDNLFVYDDLFVIMAYGAPQKIKFVHAQNGEELETVIPEHGLYILQGPARYIYFHMLMPVETQRCSIVCRRSIFRSTGTFRGGAPEFGDMLPYKADAILNTLFKNEIGGVRVPMDDDYLEKENIGPFDTGKMVRTLRPLRDWSLTSQLNEDEARLQDMWDKKKIAVNLQWRVDQLRTHFKELEKDFSIKADPLQEDPPAASPPSK